MREIKFRVRDKLTKEILGYESFNTSLNNGYLYIDLREPIDDGDGGKDYICKTEFSEHPMLKPSHPLSGLLREQCTGLKDKSGVEIYEGDIVKAFSVFDMFYEYDFDANNDPSKIYKIIFSDGCFQFENTKQWSDGCNDWRSIENVGLFKCEVIGNIYENPELLESNNE